LHEIYYYPDDEKLQEIVTNNLTDKLRELHELTK